VTHFRVIDTVPIPEIRGTRTEPFPDDSKMLWTCSRLMWAAARVVFRARIHDAHHVPRTGPVVIVPNHPSYLDPALVYALMPRRMHLMAWDALFRIPVVRWCMERGGAFPVRLAGGEREAITNARRLLKAGRCVGIFAEGGRSSRGGRMRPFRNGPSVLAIRAGAPIVPVTINGTQWLWPRGRTTPRLGGPVRMQVHPPIFPPETGPKAARGALPDQITAQVREIIASAYESGVE
jgi:1-acyl-sn-glycerol-3-phosphate acyltransferase